MVELTLWERRDVGSVPTSQTMPYKDKEQNRAYQREWARKNAKNTSRTTRRRYIQECKSKPCTDCNASYPYYVMHLDHLHDKVMNISRALVIMSFDNLKAEIDKCEVVCANCHAIRTWARGYNNGSEPLV